MPKNDSEAKNVEVDPSGLAKKSDLDDDPYGDDWRGHRRDEFKKIQKQLATPIPQDKIKERVGWKDKRTGQEHMVSYVEWTTIADILDAACADWEYHIKDMVQFGDLMVATVALTIDGVTRQGVGVGDALTEMGIKGSVSDGLKRAAVLFGPARELYRDDSPESIPTGMKPPPSKPYADSDADLASEKQISLINRLAKEKGLDAADECKRTLKGAALSEISKKAASWLIDFLQNYQPEEPTKVDGKPVTKKAEVKAEVKEGDNDPVEPSLKQQIWDTALVYYKDNDGNQSGDDAAAGISVLFTRLFGKEKDLKKMTNAQGTKLLENLVDKVRASERA